jgi:Arc/MetJ family transcription regulator
MRINVELDDALIREARKLSRAKTDRGLVDEALATFIEVETARRQREAYAERLQEVQARPAKLRMRESPTALLRQDRFR